MHYSGCMENTPYVSDMEAVAVGHTSTIERYAVAGEAVLRSGEAIPSVVQMEAMEKKGWRFEADPQGEYLAYAISPSGKELFEFDWADCKMVQLFVEPPKGRIHA